MLMSKRKNMVDATDLLYEAGYKVYAYRRKPSASGKSGFIATCIKFKPKEDM